MTTVFPEAIHVPPLKSGGLMLSYLCNQSCRHCNYRSGPEAGGWMTEQMLEAAADRLAAERHLVEIHISGGEPTLNPELLETAVRMLAERGVRLSYLETNGSYAEEEGDAEEMLSPIRDAGLGAVLVSVSPYHNEFIPLNHTRNCLNEATEIFGPEGVFPWLAHFIPMLERLDPAVPHPLSEFLEANNILPGDPILLRMFPLSPGGRAPEGLATFFPRHPAEAFKNGHCLETLTDTSHFHIDPEGRIFTGHCPGVAAGRIDDDDPWGIMSRETHPVFYTLATGGPYALMQVAESKCGFIPDPKGYASPCDLCFHVKKALLTDNPDAWPEIGPATFYRD